MSGPERVGSLMRRCNALSQTAPRPSQNSSAPIIHTRGRQAEPIPEETLDYLWHQTCKLEAQATGIYKTTNKRQPDCDVPRLVAELCAIVRHLVEPPERREEGKAHVLAK